VKEGIHPDYRPVVFQDISGEFSFITRSTIRTKDTVQWEDGNEYPLVKVDISSASHPFYTGKQKFLDAAGRIEKFRKRHQWDEAAREKAGQQLTKRKKGREKVSVDLPKFKAKEGEEEEGKSAEGRGKGAPGGGPKGEKAAAEGAKKEAPPKKAESKGKTPPASK
jgi:large subunit ribosomal protein L31